MFKVGDLVLIQRPPISYRRDSQLRWLNSMNELNGRIAKIIGKTPSGNFLIDIDTFIMDKEWLIPIDISTLRYNNYGYKCLWCQRHLKEINTKMGIVKYCFICQK